MSNASDFVIENGVLKKYIGAGGDVVIPDGVTAIGDAAFAACSSVTAVTIPDSVTSIGERAFVGCRSLMRIKIPAGIEKIEKDAFMTGSHMRWPIQGSIVIPKAYYSSGELRIDILNLSALPSWTRLLAVLCLLDDGAQKTDPRYEGYIKFIKANAAKMMWEAMIYPELLALMCQEKLIGAKDIEKFVDTAGKIGDPALIAMLLDYQVNKLTEKQKEAVVKRKEKQEDILFDRAAARMDKEGISGLNFAVAGKLETFDSSKELKVFIEENGGKLMSSVSLKIDFLIMNEDTLRNEKEKRAKELGIEIITEHQFNLKAGRHFRIKPNGELTEYVGPGGDVMIPDTVTVIGVEAFAGCETLKTVTIPNSVTSIGGCAFENCRNLEMVTISDSVTRIKIAAFGSCRKLRVVKIGGSNIEIQFPFHRSPRVTIHAPAGSSAEDYAKEHNIPFVAE